MLQAFNLSFQYSPLFGRVFSDISLSLDDGEKVALVGPNGCGKSTLLRLLAGDLQPDAGHIVPSGGGRCAYLPQDLDWDFLGTAEDAMICADPVLGPIQRRGAEADAVAQWLSEGGAARRARMVRAASLLGLPRELLNHSWQTLSLGERMRVMLAAVQGSDPAVLLLDEPTNHLDIQARLWLEGFLSAAGPAVLIVCHDRALLDATVTRVLELDRGRVVSYAGNYSQMLQAKSERMARESALWE